jgi:hypothetical protein
MSNTTRSQNSKLEAAGLAAVNVLVEAMQSGKGVIKLMAAFAVLLLPRIGRSREPEQPSWQDRTPF